MIPDEKNLQNQCEKNKSFCWNSEVINLAEYRIHIRMGSEVK